MFYSVSPEPCLEKGITQFQGLSLERRSLVRHWSVTCYEPVLVGHMNETKQNDNDELIMLNHTNLTCLCIAVRMTTTGTAPAELMIDMCTMVH